jgi:hypothetical protein
LRDIRSGAASHGDAAVGAEVRYGLTGGHGRDAEHDGDLVFAGNAIPRRVSAFVDPPGYFLSYATVLFH